LCDNCLTYFENESHWANFKTAKGDVLLTSDTQVDARPEVPGVPHCFAVVTPEKTLYVASETAEAMHEWTEKIREVVRQISSLKRGYLNKRAVVSGRDWKKRFFMLSTNVLSYYQSETSTSQQKGSFHLTSATTVDADVTLMRGDKPVRFCFAVSSSDKTMYLEASSQDDLESWIITLKDRISRLPKADDVNDKDIDFQGNLVKRAVVSGENWKMRYFELRGSSLVYFKDKYSNTSEKGRFTLTADSCVYETNLKPFAFELVTPDKVLHVSASSKKDKSEWINHLRQAIQNGIDSFVPDEMTQLGIQRSNHDQFYDVVFNMKRPIGVTLEQHGEWAVVKLVTNAQEQVEIGSVLTKVNGQNVMLDSYHTTVGRIRGWTPPMTLTFRKAPTRVGAWIDWTRLD
jgi:hypothetical protein